MKKLSARLVKLLWIVFMVAGFLVMSYPFVFGIMASLLTKDEYLVQGSLLPLSYQPSLRALLAIFQPIAVRPLLNSVTRTIWYVVIMSAQAMLAGYVLSRFRFRGRSVFMGAIVGAQLIPGALLLIPTYVWAARFPFIGGNNWRGMGGHGLVNNPLVLYVLSNPGGLLNIFLFKQATDGLNVAFEEAAAIDGANFWRTLFTIVAPMQKPILVTIALGVALGTWNDWFVPFVYLDDFKYQTLPAYVALLSTQGSVSNTDWPLVFGISTVMMIPPLLLLMWLQRYIIQGFASAGLKG